MENNSDMEFVKFGIIGTGSAWDFHKAACINSKLLRFTAVYDINQKQAEKVAKQYKSNQMIAYSNLQEFLKSDIDAVLIMVPHIFHEKYVKEVSIAKKHILLEKPMAITLESCNEMINLAKSSGIKFMIAENHRFLPAHRYIHDAIQQGLLGDVFLIRAYEGVNEIPALSQPDLWKGDQIKAGGGAFMDMGAHKFAALEWILGDKIDSITTNLYKQCINLPEKAEDNAIASIKFIKGIIGEIIVSFTQVSPPFNSLEIYGTKGTILENHMWTKPVKIYSSSDVMGEYKQKWFEPEIEHAPFPLYYNISARIEDEYFAQCIIENKEPEFTPEDARDAIIGVLMGYLSAKLNKQITRNDFFNYVNIKGSKNILENMNEYISQNPQLKKVIRTNPIGFNKERIQKIMQEKEINLLIATSPENVFYSCGLPTMPSAPNPILYSLKYQYPNICLIRQDGDISLFNWSLYQSADKITWAIDHKGTLGLKDTLRSIGSKIKKWGLEGKNIGLESYAPKYLIDYLTQKIPDSKIIDASDIFLEMRLIKTEEEIHRIEKATQISEQAIKDCINAAKIGMTDNDLLQIAKRSMIEHGAEGWDHLTLSIGDSDPEAPGIGTVLNKGDIVRFDFGATYKGYTSDVSRHLIIGEIPHEVSEMINRLIQVQEYCENIIKSGSNIKDINDKGSEFYKKLNPQGMSLVTAHSIGIECEEQHLFGPLQILDRPFEKNMVFEIEIWENFNKTLIGVEDCYVVSESGIRRITQLDKHIFTK